MSKQYGMKNKSGTFTLKQKFAVRVLSLSLVLSLWRYTKTNND